MGCRMKEHFGKVAGCKDKTFLIMSQSRDTKYPHSLFIRANEGYEELSTKLFKFPP